MSTSAPQFDSVDASDPSAAVSFLDLAYSLPAVRQLKRFSYDLLHVEVGHRVLDIGCGTGADAISLARRVGIDGKVVGIDFSWSLVQIAKARVAQLDLPLAFSCGDVHDLPFADGTFDRSRVDRVLHFLPNPTNALREVIRVTAPEGRIVITEPDWGTLAVEPNDTGLNATILSGDFRLTPSSRIGSELPQLFEQAGLKLVASHNMTVDFSDYKIAEVLFGLERIASSAISCGRVNSSDASHWLRSLQRASVQGRFHASLGGSIVSGVRSKRL